MTKHKVHLSLSSKSTLHKENLDITRSFVLALFYYLYFVCFSIYLFIYLFISFKTFLPCFGLLLLSSTLLQITMINISLSHFSHR